VTKVANPRMGFDYRRPKSAEGDVPKWILLNPVDAEEVVGINMLTGAQ